MKTKQDTKNAGDGFSAEEKAAMKARAKELKAEARANKKKEKGEQAALESIAAMPEPERTLATRLHGLITTNTDLWPKTWYGMPAYAQDGKVVCFFQAASKFNSRYATLGFQHDAQLDDGNMWPTAFALVELTADEEVKIKKLLAKAVG